MRQYMKLDSPDGGGFTISKYQDMKWMSQKFKFSYLKSTRSSHYNSFFVGQTARLETSPLS